MQKKTFKEVQIVRVPVANRIRLATHLTSLLLIPVLTLPACARSSDTSAAALIEGDYFSPEVDSQSLLGLKSVEASASLPSNWTIHRSESYDSIVAEVLMPSGVHFTVEITPMRYDEQLEWSNTRVWGIRSVSEPSYTVEHSASGKTVILCNFMPNFLPDDVGLVGMIKFRPEPREMIDLVRTILQVRGPLLDTVFDGGWRN